MAKLQQIDFTRCGWHRTASKQDCDCHKLQEFHFTHHVARAFPRDCAYAINQIESFVSTARESHFHALLAVAAMPRGPDGEQTLMLLLRRKSNRTFKAAYLALVVRTFAWLSNDSNCLRLIGIGSREDTAPL